MQPSSINHKLVNIQSEPRPPKNKSKGKSLDTIVNTTIRRSSSEESLKLESKKIKATETKRSKRDLVKGLSSRLIAPISKVRSKDTLLVMEGSTAKDTTYKIVRGEDGKKVDGNADICYINPALGLIYIVDGAGHSNPVMKKDLDEVFARFTPGYENSISKGKFKKLESVKDHLCNEMNRLHDIIRELASGAAAKTSSLGTSFIDSTDDFDVSKLPAMSFAQVITIKGQNYLLSSQFGDTSFVIQRANGELDFSLLEPKQDEPVGQRHINQSRVHVTPISSGDRIIASSDGIMEFIEQADFETVINEHPTSDAIELLNIFKSLVFEKGKQLSERYTEAELIQATDPRNQDALLGANRRALKIHDPDDRRRYDDLSLGVMTIN
ncbi:MAG: hypothetical protein ACK5MA_01845 [Parachlamydiaceae bacterium]